METPILFLTFNRPDKTARVFEVIREARPTTLYLASDGPREGREAERDLVLETRKVMSLIDWPCEVHKLYRDENLGCRKAVASAISWFFEHEESGIILEDDCLPDPSFFPFATAMLEKYNDDPRVFHVNGSNFLPDSKTESIQSTYYFSKNVHVWGWASWRRAWENYSIDMDGIEDNETQHIILSQFKDKKIGKFWISLFKHIKNKNVNTWDAQWAYATLRSKGVCITPKINLVENIGFDNQSTHTGSNDAFSFLAKEKHSLDNTNLIEPEIPHNHHGYPIRQDLDNIVSYNLYIRTFWQKAWAKLKSVI